MLTMAKDTTNTIHNLFEHSPQPQMVQVQKQEGGKDCGLFSIAVTTALAFRLDPAAIAFNQAAMKQLYTTCVGPYTA